MGRDHTQDHNYTVEGFDSDGSLAICVDEKTCLVVSFETCRWRGDGSVPVPAHERSVLELQLHQRVLNAISREFGGDELSVEAIDNDQDRRV